MAETVSIAALRQLVRQRHAAANKKVSRIRSQGIEIGGTKHDVRRDLSKVKNYNRTQLNNYLKQLNTFQSRSTNFVKGAEGAILPKSKVQQYLRAQRQWNERATAATNRRGGVNIDPAGMSVRERRAMRENTHFRGVGGHASQRLYGEVHRDPRNIRSERALDKLTRQLQKRGKRDYKQRHVTEQRKQFDDMAKALGVSANVRGIVNRLSAERFSVLWDETNLAELMGNAYFIHTSSSESAKQNFAGILEDASIEITELAEWANNFDLR